MSRKPAIFLFVLLLLLSIGGAVSYHHFRKNAPPSFEDVDAMLRSIDSKGWRLQQHMDIEGRTEPRDGWWDKFHIRRTFHHKQDGYLFSQEGSQDRIFVSIFRADGKVSAVSFSHSSIEPLHGEPVRSMTLDRFPLLRPHVVE